MGIRRSLVRKGLTPQLDWSGPEASGLASDTGDVYEELFSSAMHSPWVASFVRDHDPDVFGELAANIDTTPGLEVRLLLNIDRRRGRKTGGTGTRLWCGDSLTPFGDSGPVSVVPSCVTIGDPWTCGTAEGSTPRPLWRTRNRCSLPQQTSHSQLEITTSNSDCLCQVALKRLQGGAWCLYRFVPEPVGGGHLRSLAPDLPIKDGRGGIAHASSDQGLGPRGFMIVVRIFGERESASDSGLRHAVD